VNVTIAGGQQYWVLIVNDYTGFKWSRFVKECLDLPQAVIPLLKELETKKYIIKFLWMDNARENKELAATAKQWGTQLR